MDQWYFYGLNHHEIVVSFLNTNKFISCLSSKITTIKGHIEQILSTLKYRKISKRAFGLCYTHIAQLKV